MSYKRVVEKNGKKYGPYIYESYRDKDGNVRKKYLGKLDKKKERAVFSFFVVGILIVAFILGLSYTTYLAFGGEVSGGIFDNVGSFLSASYNGFTGFAIGTNNTNSDRKSVV